MNLKPTLQIHVAKKKKEREKHIIDHTLRNNNYDSTTTNTRKNRSMENRTQTQKTKWAKFTYTSRETRFITKLFKPFDIGIAFTTKNNIGTLLRENSDNSDNKYNRGGVYQLTCTDCNKKYIGQTGRPFHVQYKEHAREYTHDNNKYNFAKHLLYHQHTLRPMEESMTILHAITKGPMMNTLEKFHIYKETRNNNQLNDKNRVMLNAIFDTILHNSSDKTLGS
jgi:hypothetical protein